MAGRHREGAAGIEQARGAESREEALEWASRVPGSDNETIEVRRMFEMSDFDPIQKKFGDIDAEPGEQWLCNSLRLTCEYLAMRVDFNARHSTYM
jgi:hypothetical protein